MRILVNATAAKMGGALRHLKGFVGSLGKDAGEHEFWVCADPDVRLESAPNVRLVPIDYRGSMRRQILWHQIEAPRLAMRLRCDRILSMLNFGPVKPPVPQVLFERNPIYFCPFYRSVVGRRERADALLQRWLIYLTMRASNAVVTPTAAMQSMIRAAFPGFPQDRFRVIFHGFDRPGFLRNSQPLPDRVTRLLEKRNPQQFNILYATHPAPYKGVEVLFRGLSVVLKDGVKARLFLTMHAADRPNGSRSYGELAEDLGVSKSTVFLGRVPQTAIVSVYRACDLFVFPSLCESFGFPMLEAMSAGLPVVAAETAVNREILGQAALFYSPLDDEAAASQIRNALSNPAVTSRLAEASLERMSEVDWGWERYTRQVLATMN